MKQKLEVLLVVLAVMLGTFLVFNVSVLSLRSLLLLFGICVIVYYSSTDETYEDYYE